jgi:hypothetical protein
MITRRTTTYGLTIIYLITPTNSKPFRNIGILVAKASTKKLPVSTNSIKSMEEWKKKNNGGGKKSPFT